MRHCCKVFLLNDSGEKFFGRGPAELLERVEQCGSLRRAAKEMYLSYSKALKIIHTAERELGVSLLRTEAGGTGGGGSILTEEAHITLSRFRAYEAAMQDASEHYFATHML